MARYRVRAERTLRTPVRNPPQSAGAPVLIGQRYERCADIAPGVAIHWQRPVRTAQVGVIRADLSVFVGPIGRYRPIKQRQAPQDHAEEFHSECMVAGGMLEDDTLRIHEIPHLLRETLNRRRAPAV